MRSFKQSLLFKLAQPLRSFCRAHPEVEGVQFDLAFAGEQLQRARRDRWLLTLIDCYCCSTVSSDRNDLFDRDVNARRQRGAHHFTQRRGIVIGDPTRDCQDSGR